MRLSFMRQMSFAPEGEGGAGGGGNASGPAASPSPSSSAPSAAAAPTVTSSTPSGASQAAPAPSSVPDAGGLKDAPSDEVAPFDFSGEFFEPEDDLVTVEIPAEPVAQAGTPLQVQQTQEPQPPPPTPPSASAQEPQAPAAPAPAEQAPNEVSPPLDPSDPGTLLRALTENRDMLEASLAAHQFAMSKEEAEAFESDPVGTLPKIAARAYVTTMQASINVMAKMIPAMIQRYQQVTQVASSLEDKFYSKWGDIKRDQHGEIVQKAATIYRQMNPKATPDRMIEELGPIVMAMAKIQPSPQMQQTQLQPQSQPPRRVQAFVPAGGSPPTGMPQMPMASEWEALGADGD